MEKRKKTSKFKVAEGTRFLLFSQKMFPEHTQKMKRTRSQAKTALFVYPTFGLLLGTIPLLMLKFASSILFSRNPSWLANMMSPELGIEILGYLNIASLAGGVLGVIVATGLALSRADSLILHSESIEMQLRQVFYLRNLHQNNIKTSRVGVEKSKKLDFPKIAS